MPPKYEYKTVVLQDPQYDLPGFQSQPPHLNDAETVLNSYGNDGWELVSVNGGNRKHQYYFKRELQQEPQVDETEVNTDEILSGMNNLNVDTEPPAPTPGVFTFGTPAPSSCFREPP